MNNEVFYTAKMNEKLKKIDKKNVEHNIIDIQKANKFMIRIFVKKKEKLSYINVAKKKDEKNYAILRLK